MAVCGGKASSVPSLPPPRPKSPPKYPDLYGKRRELAKVQMIEREIGFLEEELKFVEGLPPASRTCKQVADFVVANSDPLILMTKKKKRYCRFWKWLCGVSCFNISWICCCACSPHCKMPQCCRCSCNLCTCQSCCNCSIPKCHCCSWWRPSECLRKRNCSLICCIPRCFSCSNCSCKRCNLCSLTCPKVDCSCCCTKNCCFPCYFCY